jgi:crossover junction endodeoxyribonuclease RuvC
MFDACVLGVDPGVARCGLAVLRRQGKSVEIVWADTAGSPSDLPESERLAAVGAAVNAAISAHSPDHVAIERVAWNVNKRSAMAVARATGVVMAAAAVAGLPVSEYGSREVKNAVTGSGSADKSQVRSALERVHRLSRVPRQDDAADAVAIALTHIVGMPMTAGAIGSGVR